MLHGGQEKVRLKDPTRASSRRRLVMGLREVMRGVRANKVREIGGEYWGYLAKLVASYEGPLLETNTNTSTWNGLDKRIFKCLSGFQHFAGRLAVFAGRWNQL